jgi:hypothetical protein
MNNGPLALNGFVVRIGLMSMLFLGFIHLSNGAPAPSARFESGQTQTSLLELYTSEGCSSCPPAEKWLSQLQQSPGLWKTFVPVAFHVDYWNHLGWRDKWSKPEFTARQEAYSRAWASESVYTPAFVLNGREWHAQNPIPSAASSNPGTLVVSNVGSNRWSAEFSPSKRNDGPYEVHLAVLISGVGVDVGAGENSGRHLEHDFVVVALKDASMDRHGDSWKASAEVQLESSGFGNRTGIAAWVTKQGDLVPVQATGGWMSEPAGK